MKAIKSINCNPSEISPAVPERTAANGVNDDKHYEEDNVDNGNLLPVTLELVQQASLA